MVSHSFFAVMNMQIWFTLPRWTLNALTGSLLLSIFFVTSGCEFREIRIDRVEILNIDTSNPSLVRATIKLRINNPNSFPLKIKSADFSVLNGQIDMGSAHLRKPFKIPARSNLDHTVELDGEFRNLLSGGLNSLADALAGKKTLITLRGEIVAKSYLMRREFPVELSAPLPRIGF